VAGLAGDSKSVRWASGFPLVAVVAALAVVVAGAPAAAVPATAGAPKAAAVGGRYADLEGYRGLAALSIVAHHLFQYVDAGNGAFFTDHSAPT